MHNIGVTFSNNVLIISVDGLGKAITILTDLEIPRTTAQLNTDGFIWLGGAYNGGCTASCSDSICNFTPLA